VAVLYRNADRPRLHARPMASRTAGGPACVRADFEVLSTCAGRLLADSLPSRTRPPSSLRSRLQHKVAAYGALADRADRPDDDLRAVLVPPSASTTAPVGQYRTDPDYSTARPAMKVLQSQDRPARGLRTNRRGCRVLSITGDPWAGAWSPSLGMCSRGGRRRPMIRSSGGRLPCPRTRALPARRAVEVVVMATRPTVEHVAVYAPAFERDPLSGRITRFSDPPPRYTSSMARPASYAASSSSRMLVRSAALHETRACCSTRRRTIAASTGAIILADGPSAPSAYKRVRPQGDQADGVFVSAGPSSARGCGRTSASDSTPRALESSASPPQDAGRRTWRPCSLRQPHLRAVSRATRTTTP